MSRSASHRMPRSADQADGLRRMFSGAQACLVPLVANPHVDRHGAVLARLAGAFAEQGLHTLVVDAADTSPEPGELAFIDLAACVEPLGPALAYLAALDLPMKHVDTHGSCASFVPRMMGLVPHIDVVVLHAEARVLARMLAARDLRPLVLASGETDALTHAYAALKLLTGRLGLQSFDLVLPVPAARRGPQPAQLARRISDCADRFLGTALHDWVAIDPEQPFGQPASPELQRLIAAQLGIAGTPGALPPAWAVASAHPRMPSSPSMNA